MISLNLDANEAQVLLETLGDSRDPRVVALFDRVMRASMEAEAPVE